MNSDRVVASFSFSCCIRFAILIAIAIAISGIPLFNARDLNARGVPSLGDDSCSTEVSESLEAARNRYQLFSRLREFNVLMETLRSKLQRTAAVDNWLEQRDVSRVMQEALDLSERLSAEISNAGKIAEKRADISGSDKLAQQAAAMADLPVRLVSAVKTAQTSIKSSRLKNLKSVIKDSKKLIGIVERLDPAKGELRDVLGLAVEDIASAAEKTEAFISDPTSILKQINEGLERTEKIYREPTKLDRALESTQSEIRTKERQCDPEAYAEVADAEESCLVRSGLDLRRLADLRYRVTAMLPGSIAQIESVIYKLETGSKDMAIQMMVENERLWYLETVSGSATPSTRLSASGQIPAQKLKIFGLEADLREFNASKDEKLATAKQRLSKYEQESARSEARLSEFDNCVRKGLRNASHADIAYLSGSFPQYIAHH